MTTLSARDWLYNRLTRPIHLSCTGCLNIVIIQYHFRDVCAKFWRISWVEAASERSTIAIHIRKVHFTRPLDQERLKRRFKECNFIVQMAGFVMYCMSWTTSRKGKGIFVTCFLSFVGSKFSHFIRRPDINWGTFAFVHRCLSVSLDHLNMVHFIFLVLFRLRSDQKIGGQMFSLRYQNKD